MVERPEPASEPPADTRPSAEPALIADGREHALDPNAVTAARIAGGVAAAVLSLALLVATIGFLLASFPGPPLALLALGGWLVAVAGLGVLAFVWPAVRHRHISYRLDERGIRIRRGVVWRSEVTVPKSRVQHTDVSRGPIERSLDLATLIVHTAGTEQASVSLGGLPRADAYRIRDYLIEGGEDDAV